MSDPMIIHLDSSAVGLTLALPIGGIIGSVTADWGNGVIVPYVDGFNRILGTTIKIYGNFTTFGGKFKYIFQLKFGINGAYIYKKPLRGNLNMINHIVSVVSWGSNNALTSLANAFYNSSSLTSVPANIPSTVTSLVCTFYKTAVFNQNLSTWNTSNVTDMGGMFYGPSSLYDTIGQYIHDLSSWNVSKVKHYKNFFYSSGPNAKESPYSPFSKPMIMTFKPGTGTVQIPITKGYFNWGYYSKTRTGIPVNGIVKIYGQIIIGALANSEFKNNLVSVVWGDNDITSFKNFLNGCTSLISVSDYIPPSVTNTSGMFANTTLFNMDISNWNTRNVTDMSSMFSNSVFNKNINSWNLHIVTDISGMFLNNAAFNQPLSDWNVKRVTNMSYMFKGASTFNQNIGHWKVYNVKKMAHMFNGASNFNKSLSYWHVSNVTDMASMFLNTTSYNQIGDNSIKRWHVNNVTDMSRMFENSKAKDDLSAWRVGQVTDMTAMFKNASDISGNFTAWRPVAAKAVDQMFYNTTSMYNGTFKSNISVWTFLSPPTNSQFFFISGVDKTTTDPFSPFSSGSISPLILTFSDSTVVKLPIIDGSGITIDWGTGTAVAASAPYSGTPTGPVKVYGTFTGFGSENNNATYKANLTGVTSWNSSTTSLANAFNGCTALTSVATPPATVTNMSGMFQGATTFNQDLSWNTVAVTNMQSMFQGAETFNGTLTFNTSAVLNMNRMFSGAAFNNDLSWNTVNVTDMSYMFNGATVFNGTLTFNTSAVLNMQGMFGGAAAFNNDLSWNTVNVTDMSYMFFSAASFDKPLAFNTGAVTTMSYMFVRATLFNKDLSFNTVNVTDMSSMFENTEAFNGSLTFNTGAVTNMSGMFSNARAFDKPLAFNTGAVTNMSRMFSGAAFNQDLSWNTVNVTDMNNMFGKTTFFNKPLAFNTGAVTNMSGMFKLTIAFNQDLSFNTVNVTDMASMFSGAAAFDKNLASWDVSGVIDMSYMFSGATALYDGDNFRYDLTDWNVERVTLKDYFFSLDGGYDTTEDDPKSPFYIALMILTFSASEEVELPIGGGTNITIDWGDGTAVSANLYYSGTPTGPVKVYGTFTAFGTEDTTTNYQNNLTSVISWGPSPITSMQYAFNGCTALTSVPAIPATVTDLQGMFLGATLFNQDLSWNTVNVTDMSSMFSGATAFNKNLASWNTPAVTNMSYMFSGATALYDRDNFRYDLTDWNVERVTLKDYFFNSSGEDTTTSDSNSPFKE